jgi:membrane protease subunit HflK
MRYVLLGLVVAALVVTLATSATQINAGERGVVRRFGKVVEIAGPGLHLGLPWGIDQVDVVNVDRVRQVKIGYSDGGGDELNLATPPGQLVTGDHNLVNVQLTIDYAVNDTEVEQFLLHADQADGLVARAAEAVLAEWVAGRGVNEVLLTGKVALPSHLVAETQKRLAPYQLGVQIRVANVGHLLAPKEVKAAFDDVTRAEAEIETQLNEAGEEANRLLGEAGSEADHVRRMAQTHAEQVVDAALARARVFAKNRDFFQFARQRNPNYLVTVWRAELNAMYAQIQKTGLIDLLDHLLGPNGFDIWQPLSWPKKN